MCNLFWAFDNLNKMLLCDITFSEGKNFMWWNKFVKRVLLVRKLQQQRQVNPQNSICRMLSSDCAVWLYGVTDTCGESLNMGAHTMRGVEWCFAARASVCVPLSARRPPLARTVCVPMMTWTTHTRKQAI